MHFPVSFSRLSRSSGATHEYDEAYLCQRLYATDPLADQSEDKHRLRSMICRYDRLLPSSVSPSSTFNLSATWSNLFVVVSFVVAGCLPTFHREITFASSPPRARDSVFIVEYRCNSICGFFPCTITSPKHRETVRSSIGTRIACLCNAVEKEGEENVVSPVLGSSSYRGSLFEC